MFLVIYLYIDKINIIYFVIDNIYIVFKNGFCIQYQTCYPIINENDFLNIPSQ